jgi:hypothetical protein
MARPCRDSQHGRGWGLYTGEGWRFEPFTAHHIAGKKSKGQARIGLASKISGPRSEIRQTASFNSLAARNATFLLALIWIGSPVAGLRPMRAARFLT